MQRPCGELRLPTLPPGCHGDGMRRGGAPAAAGGGFAQRMQRAALEGAQAVRQCGKLQLLSQRQQRAPRAQAPPAG